MGPIEHAKLINDSIGHYCASDSLYNIAHLQIANQMASDGPVAFDMLRNLGLLSGMIGIVVAGVLFIISIAISKFRIEYKFLKWLFLISWLFAFAIYDVGMCIDNRALTLLLNAPMAMLHAFGTFVLSSDVSEIHSQFFDSTLFMALFSASHALSAFVSALFLIKVFGFNIVQRIRLYLESLRPCQREETYVFWGSNSASYRLIESIKKHFEGNDSRYRIIVVKISDTSEESSETTIGINKIFEFISIKNSELQQLQNLGCFMTHSSSSDLDSSSNFSADNNEPFRDIINGKLHLRSLTKILLEKTSDTIHFLLLSDDENDNLHDVSVLLNDTTLNKFANSNSQNGKQRKIILYCHARYNGVHRVIEDCHRSNNMEVRVIDSSHINVELLKKNEDVLPVNFVDVAADASVSSPFNAMVIGFSEVGQDATRFLYEFGSFVKSGGNSDHAARSSFHLDVVDNRMEEKAGAFIMNAPAISPSLSFVAELNNPKTLIEFHNEDCRSVSFSKMLERKIKTLHYVVIATGDDELNMTLGVRIFRIATRYRDNLDKLCILIRIHNDDDGHFEKIATYYNKLWASQDMTDIAGKRPNLSFKRSDISKLPLYIFGQDEDVYTYANIIDNSIINKAVEYKEKYAASTDDNYKPPFKKEHKSWYREIDDLSQANDIYHPSYARIMRLRRTQYQDIANSLHKKTKELLRDKALVLNNISNFSWSSLQRFSRHTNYSSVTGITIDPRIVRILTVIAQTEHLRWKASHEILGYVYDKTGKDEIRFRHNCLTEWENLNEEVRSYDHDVVDVTFGIINPENKIKNIDKND